MCYFASEKVSNGHFSIFTLFFFNMLDSIHPVHLSVLEMKLLYCCFKIRKHHIQTLLKKSICFKSR